MEDFRKIISRLKRKNKSLISENETLKRAIIEKDALINQLKEVRPVEESRGAISNENELNDKETVNSRVERQLSRMVSTQMGQWDQMIKRMSDLKNEFTYLRKKINQSQVPPRKLIKKISRDQIRVGIFVDVQNIFYGARKFNAKLDFDLLLEKTISKRRLIRAFAYVVQTSDVDQSGFLTMLQHKSFEVKSKNLRLRSDGSAKANWDIEITIDMLSLSDKFDVVIVVSGDGDFVPLVNILKTLGPLVEVYSFPHNTSRDLMEAADKYYPIDESYLILNEYQPLNDNRRAHNDQEDGNGSFK